MEFLSMQFFTALGTIILLDILLGGDNAVVIAMAANKLSPALRKKAILIGTAGAVIIRLIMTFIAVWLLTIPYLQVIGGLILLPIAVKLLVPEEHHDEVKAIAGASHGSFLLVAIGFLVSIPIIVGGSTIIGRLMDRFPVILYAGAGLLGWTAGSMIGHDKILGPMIQASVGSWAPLAIQIFLAVGVIAVGLVMSRNVTAKAQG